jgi:GH18 family chitinase
MISKPLLATLLLALAPLPAEAQPVTLGYIPAFKGLGAAIAGADFSAYSHVAIAFVNPDSTGEIVAGEQMACMLAAPGRAATVSDLRHAVAAAHKGGSKVLASLGGGVIPPCSGDWAALLRPESRGALVEKLVRLVDEFGLDGVDVDLEGELMTRIDRNGDYTPFVAALSAALKARGKLLTCATASYEGGMVPRSSIPYFDYVGIMSYDAIGPSWGQAGSEHSPYAQAERDLRLWLDRGVPRERLLLGLPFYGYGFGTGYRPNYAVRDIKAEFGKRALKRDVVGKLCAGCAYVTYNGLETLRKKARLAREQAGGIMVWEVSQDTDDRLLIRTVRKALRLSARRAR